MPSSSNALRRWLGLHARGTGPSGPSGPADPRDPPLRAELLNAEQMEVRGRALARVHQVETRAGSDALIARLRQNEALLAQANASLASMVRDKVRITPAGEWFLDNFHLIEEQVRTARLHLPKGYSRELPVLVQGGPAGLPRVYHLALEAVAHGDGWVDTETIRRFISAYQEVEPLRLGELWAVPIMLRLAILENLRRMAAQVMRDGDDRRLAGEWAARLAHVAETRPKDLVLELAEMARTAPPVSGSFVSTLSRGLQGRSVALSMPMAWLEHWAQDAGHGVEALIQAESQQQAADQVSVSNSIGSLRFLAQMDWRDFVEGLSAVDQALREDPSGVYPQMDFLTRDHYRHVVERLARLGDHREADVARHAVRLAQAHPDPTRAASHVGYYLVDDGLVELREVLREANPAKPLSVGRPRVPLPAYLLPIAFLTAAFTVALLSAASPTTGFGVLTVILSVLAAIVFSELAITLVNWGATVIVAPRPLPRMDFSRGIPSPCRTLVVVPCMFGSQVGVDALVEALEVRYLANRDPNLQFALLSDFLDAETSVLPADEALLQHAAERVGELNERHASKGVDRFFLLHRPRVWNGGEGVWMGSERKRGKLAALNKLLLTGATDAFIRIAGDPGHLVGTRYVITLDADTRLPRDAARELVATLAHPLNRAQFDPVRRRIVRGYGILQPGVGSSMGGLAELALRLVAGHRTGNRSLYPRRVGRLPGPVRRRLVRRQGHL
ncbi:hypothetical protein [Alkalisalibacterium limincola]|uniref:hypothetical protein n=1 Tax=Alkalisalibacterium limincola TaxID=2699169 RepID=UPI0021060543|nr:hypothetical protein [Alkalisalibacterium limincola]